MIFACIQRVKILQSFSGSPGVMEPVPRRRCSGAKKPNQKPYWSDYGGTHVFKLRSVSDSVELEQGTSVHREQEQGRRDRVSIYSSKPRIRCNSPGTMELVKARHFYYFRNNFNSKLFLLMKNIPCFGEGVPTLVMMGTALKCHVYFLISSMIQ